MSPENRSMQFKISVSWKQATANQTKGHLKTDHCDSKHVVAVQTVSWKQVTAVQTTSLPLWHHKYALVAGYVKIHSYWMNNGWQ